MGYGVMPSTLFIVHFLSKRFPNLCPIHNQDEG